jgi:hypothetical protein
MKILKKILLNIYNFLLKIVSHPSLNFLFTIVAIYISWITLHHADKQFELNSKSSDSLFNVQLKNSKELNENLIGRIRELQNITKTQLGVNSKQLDISTNALKEQIYSGRPKVIVILDDVEDTTNVNANVYGPKIITVTKNEGSRYALNCSLRPFLLLKDFKIYKHGLYPKVAYNLEPTNPRENSFLPKFPLENKYDFYYVYDINYYDDQLKQTFRHSYYYHYYRMRNVGAFYNCKNNEKEELKKNINDELKAMNEPLLPDE